jgi:hypothetical protein
MGRVVNPRDRDVGRFLGLVGRWAWALFAFYMVAFSIIAIVGGSPSAGMPLTVVSLAFIALAAVAMTSPSATPLPPARLAIVAVGSLGAVTTLAFALPARMPSAQPEWWQLDAVNFIVFVVALRGRAAAAWIIAAAVVAIMVVWSTLRAGGPFGGLVLTYGQVVSLVAGTFFAVGLQRTTRQVFAQQDAEEERAGEEAAREAGDAHRAAELQQIRALAEPTLRAIAERRTADLAGALVLEAALRDRIRGASLAREPLVAELRRARDAGRDVLLLDDAEDAPPPEAVADGAAMWCADLLCSARGQRVTIRLAVEGAEWVVSLVDADGELAERRWAGAGSGSTSPAGRDAARAVAP